MAVAIAFAACIGWPGLLTAGDQTVVVHGVEGSPTAAGSVAPNGGDGATPADQVTPPPAGTASDQTAQDATTAPENSPRSTPAPVTVSQPVPMPPRDAPDAVHVPTPPGQAAAGDPPAAPAGEPGADPATAGGPPNDAERRVVAPSTDPATVPWDPRALPAPVAAPAPAPAPAPVETRSSEAPRRPSLLPLVQPLWSELSDRQRQILAPLESEWNVLSIDKKRPWLALADRIPKMSADKRATAEARIREWAALTPEQRRQARTNYRIARTLPKDERVSSWEQYQAMTPEQRDELRKGRTSNTAARLTATPSGLATRAAQPLFPRRSVPVPRSIVKPASHGTPGRLFNPNRK